MGPARGQNGPLAHAFRKQGEQRAGDEVGHVMAHQGHGRSYRKLLEMVVHEHGKELVHGSVGGGMQGYQQHDGQRANSQ